MTTLDELTKRREVDVETPAGVVRLKTPTFAAIAPLMELEPASQGPALIAACAISPTLTPDDARELAAATVLALLPECMKLCGLGAPSD